jgi:hypothetical protein
LPGEELSSALPREMSQKEGIAHIKGILKEIETTRKMEKAKKRKRDVLKFQLPLPFVDELGYES